jgi:hypothetical protein
LLRLSWRRQNQTSIGTGKKTQTSQGREKRKRKKESEESQTHKKGQAGKKIMSIHFFLKFTSNETCL